MGNDILTTSCLASRDATLVITVLECGIVNEGGAARAEVAVARGVTVAEGGGARTQRGQPCSILNAKSPAAN